MPWVLSAFKLVGHRTALVHTWAQPSGRNTSQLASWDRFIDAIAKQVVGHRPLALRAERALHLVPAVR
jgi:hypothetical protein